MPNSFAPLTPTQVPTDTEVVYENSRTLEPTSRPGQLIDITRPSRLQIKVSGTATGAGADSVQLTMDAKFTQTAGIQRVIIAQAGGASTWAWTADLELFTGSSVDYRTTARPTALNVTVQWTVTPL